MSAGILAFDRWGAFTDTFEPYRVWTLCDDMPELELSRGDSIYEVAADSRDQGPDHDAQWDGHRFQVRRKENEALCELEDWQIAPLFGGEVPPWPLEGAAMRGIRAALMDVMPLGKKALCTVGSVMADMLKFVMEQAPEPATSGPPAVPISDSDYAYLRSLVPIPVWESSRGQRHPVCTRRRHWAALLAERDVPGTPIRRGDVVLEVTSDGEPPNLRGARIRVPRACLSVVAEHLEDSFRVLEMAQARGWWTRDLERLAKRIRVRQRPTWKDSTSPLLIVRPLVAPVSEPIEASSDDAALFELLSSVGGRMPHG